MIANVKTITLALRRVGYRRIRQTEIGARFTKDLKIYLKIVLGSSSVCHNFGT